MAKDGIELSKMLSAPRGKMKTLPIKEPIAMMKKGGEVKGLTPAQKAKLPKALQEAILRKRGLMK